MPYAEESTTFAALFPRQSGCVVCQDGSPSCPSCPDGQECQISVPLDCTQCPQAYCAASASSSSGSPSKSSSKASGGAIAGAVIGGLALVAIVGVVTYFVWKHCVKNKRAQMEQAAWDDDGEYGGQREKDFNTMRDARASGQTRNSIASTVLTRASNIIQIAYIPGVTNRATPTSPTLLVPPVPPIPIAVSSQAGTPSTGDQHFFVPGDLRDSMASGMSGYTDRTSYARNSYAPRSSVASTIYGKAGVIVTPAQTGMRAKAAMVSVKSTGSGSSGESTVPPVPVVDKRRFQDQNQLSPTGSTFSVGSTFLNNATSANTATAVRAQMVRVGSNLKQSTSASEKSIKEEDGGNSGASTPDTLPRQRDEQNSPFRDPPTESARESSQTLSAVIEGSTRTPSQSPSTVRAVSPFGDEHATS
ncbi:Protein OPY2 [Cytospora mali]|uniref:Protein OPY2 n=1 Tax=Cytospora mali TaxID=578113 RepID=A0A194V3D3_CYTMA|nr:Protein OPY2 [Valsa mali var. pyri (nom. inval.)]